MGNVISDVFGVSGQEILNALLKKTPLNAGELADLSKKRLRNRIGELTEALEDHYMNDHHRWLIGQSVDRSEEHTSELQHSQISYAVFCLKKKKKTKTR